MSESYIVRIYRRSEEDPNTIAGLLEVVETGGVKQFKGGRALADLLSRTGNRRRKSLKPACGGTGGVAYSTGRENREERNT